jgi:hypothetical protein
MEGGSPGRILLVIDEAIRGDQLRDQLIDHLGESPEEIFLVAPALSESALKHHLGDVDDAIDPARERLERSLKELRDAGFEARGEVGDSDPIIAISDEIQKFHPDRIVVVAHGEGHEAHAERGLLERAERDFNQPVTELRVVPAAAEPKLEEVAESAPGAGRGKGRRPSRNMPPLTSENIIGIVVAVVGTLALGILAAACAGADHSSNLEEGRLGDVCPILLLIAMFGALVNLAHVVGLVFFQGVSYEGIWQRFFARLSMFGTPIAVALSLVLYLQR